MMPEIFPYTCKVLVRIIKDDILSDTISTFGNYCSTEWIAVSFTMLAPSSNGMGSMNVDVMPRMTCREILSAWCRWKAL